MTAMLGEVAAIGTALLWALTYVQFTVAVRRIGPSTLNRLRLLAALVLLFCAHTVVYGSPLPIGAEASRWGWLALSGVVGFAISDAFLFRGLLHLGAHRTSLVMSLIPVTSALMAWGTLGERLTGIQIVAGLVTVAGIAVVVAARDRGAHPAPARGRGVGVAFALAAVVAQSARYIFSVEGLRGGFPPLSANVLQILAATAALWIVALVRGTVRPSLRALRDRPAAAMTVGGAVTGPFLGVTFSLVALAGASVGVASTLMALSPVFLLPISRLAFREPITLRAGVGTGLAVLGVALLFLF